MEKKKIITIDGPAGAGKSTVSKALAKKLGYIYLDTGALYRALAYKALKVKISLEDTSALANLCSNTSISLKNIYAQVIDDAKNQTLVSASSLEKALDKKKKMELSVEVGKLVAKRALEKGIKEVYFDRGRYKYHGRIKAVADSARKEGLKF